MFIEKECYGFGVLVVAVVNSARLLIFTGQCSVLQKCLPLHSPSPVVLATDVIINHFRQQIYCAAFRLLQVPYVFFGRVVGAYGRVVHPTLYYKGHLHKLSLYVKTPSEEQV